MIELDDIKVLRYNRDDLYKLKPADTEWGVNWLVEHVKSLYPEMHVLYDMYDAERDYVWVLLAPYDFTPISSVEIGEDGKPFIQERIEKHYP